MKFYHLSHTERTFQWPLGRSRLCWPPSPHPYPELLCLPSWNSAPITTNFTAPTPPHAHPLIAPHYLSHYKVTTPTPGSHVTPMLFVVFQLGYFTQLLSLCFFCVETWVELALFFSLGRMTSYYNNMLYFIYLFIHQWPIELFPLLDYRKQCWYGCELH